MPIEFPDHAEFPDYHVSLPPWYRAPVMHWHDELHICTLECPHLSNTRLRYGRRCSELACQARSGRTYYAHPTLFTAVNYLAAPMA
jgi:hypothetical protein